MIRSCLALVVLIGLGPMAIASESAQPVNQQVEREIERAIEQARRQIDEAARQLAELHQKQYAMGSGKKKAMLGILLGDGPMKDGVEMVGVTPGGGAEAAGLQAGDIIVEMDGLSLTETDNPMRTLSRYMKEVAPGDEVAVVYERNNERQAATITTQAHTTHMMKVLSDKMDNLDIDLDLDFDFDDLDGMDGKHKSIWVHKGKSHKALLAVAGDLAAYFDVDEGVIVLEPPAGSQLKAGDVLLNIAGEDVADMESAMARLAEIDEQTEVEVKRHGKRLNLSVAAEEFASMGGASRVIRIRKPVEDDEEVVVKVEVSD